MMAKKPVSLGMTIHFTTDTFERLLTIPDFEKGLEKKFSKASAKMATPEEFDAQWDEFFKEITGEKKK